MSLYVDSDHVTVADMLALDPEVSEIASAEGITIDGDGGIVGQAWDECADALLANLQSFGSGVYFPAGTIYAAMNTFTSNRPRVSLSQICVSPQNGRRNSTLKRWMTYKALVLFYRAAINRPNGQDRYEARMERTTAELAERWRELYSAGVPVVAQPLPCPGATHELHTGTFDADNLSHVSGGSLSTDTSYLVAITWTDATAYTSQASKGNAESGPSAIVTYTIPAGQRLVVSIAGLMPPGSVPYPASTAEGYNTRRTASHWNVYVGALAGEMVLQNASPIPIGTTTYTLDSDPLLSGYGLESGQFAERNEPLQAMLQRG